MASPLGGIVVFMTVGCLLNALFVGRPGAGRVLGYAVCMLAAAGVTAAVLRWIEARYGTIGLLPFLLCFIAQIGTLSLIGPNATARWCCGATRTWRARPSSVSRRTGYWYRAATHQGRDLGGEAPVR